MSYFDIYGWYTTEVLEGRHTQSDPKSIPDMRISGELYPRWNHREWVMVPYEEYDPITEPEAPKPTRYITVGAFFDRFGTQKWAILQDSNPLVQALIKDCSVRKFIDLDAVDLPDGLQLVVNAGHNIDIDYILNNKIKPYEAA